MSPFDPVPDPIADHHVAPLASDSADDCGSDEPVPALVAKTIGVVGRSLIVVGLLLLAFAGFQLWGTGIAEARAQEQLAADFSAQLESRPGSAPAAAKAAPRYEVSDRSLQTLSSLRRTPTAVPMLPQTPAPTPTEVVSAIPEAGQPIGRIEIPVIDLDKTIVEGTSREELRSGPGHYGFTPLPGQPGNVAIAGHRTTHGAPFFDIDLLQPGDEINVETVDGTFTYLVEGQDDGNGGLIGHSIVDPSDVAVITDKGDDRLTLTACHPKYSAKQRIIVTATLQPNAPTPIVEPIAEPTNPTPPELLASAAPDTKTQTEAPETANVEAAAPETAPTQASPTPAAMNKIGDQATIDESLGWQRQYAAATIGWAAITALIAATGWEVGRFWRRNPAYAMTVPPFGLALYYCFVNLEHFLPAV
ncbi:MAG: class E sortase [Acidimicrobiales bacterium]